MQVSMLTKSILILKNQELYLRVKNLSSAQYSEVFHILNTFQMIIDNMKNIRHVHSGFLGHENDAGTYQQIGPIGAGQYLDIPADCFLLADGINPNKHPLVTAYRSAEMVRRPPREQHRRRKFNLLHRQRRVYVEHVIK